MGPLDAATVVEFPAECLAAVTVEAFGLSATDHLGFKARHKAAIGWNALQKLTRAWVYVDTADVDYLLTLANFRHLKNTSTLSMVEERLRSEIVLHRLFELPTDDQHGLFILMELLNQSVLLMPKELDIGSQDDTFPLSPAFWRLWLIQMGPAPFVEAWTGLNLTVGLGRFIYEVRDEWTYLHPVAKKIRRSLSREVDKWHRQMKRRYNYEILTTGSLADLGTDPKFFEKVTCRVQDW